MVKKGVVPNSKNKTNKNNNKNDDNNNVNLPFTSQNDTFMKEFKQIPGAGKNFWVAAGRDRVATKNNKNSERLWSSAAAWNRALEEKKKRVQNARKVIDNDPGDDFMQVDDGVIVQLEKAATIAAKTNNKNKQKSNKKESSVEASTFTTTTKWTCSRFGSESKIYNNPYHNVPLGPIREAHGAPKQALGSYYGQLPEKVQLGQQHYNTWDNGAAPHELYFTATFTCPITKEVFYSGQYGDPKFYKLDDSNIENNNNNDNIHGDKSINNGEPIVWYKRKILAEHAAAGRAYDCFHFRKMTPGEGYAIICKEQPYYAPGHDPQDQEHSFTAAETTTSTTTTTTALNDDGPTPMVVQDTPLPVPVRANKNSNPSNSSPKQQLNTFYNQLTLKLQLGNSNYTTWECTQSKVFSSPSYFTSIFICPITLERFASGRYGDSKYYTTIKDKATGATVVWYTKKILAQHGAAARAMDCINYRLSSRQQQVPPPTMIGTDIPYLFNEPEPLPTIPKALLSLIPPPKNNLDTSAAVYQSYFIPPSDNNNNEQEKERQNDREAYLKARKGQK